MAAEDPNTYIYELSPLFDLYRAGALGIYLYALTEGRESPAIAAFLEREGMAYAKAQRLRQLDRLSALAMALVRQYLLIVDDKLGTPRYNKLMEELRRRVGRGVRRQGAPWALPKSPIPTVLIEDPGVVLGLLSAKERALVLTEYENRKLEWEAQVKNQCPHVRLARRLRTTPTAQDALDILTELGKYIVEPRGKGAPIDALRDRAGAVRDDAGRDEREADASPQTQWLRCKNCGFRVICPHVRDRVRLEGRGVSYDEMRTRLARYAVRYAARASDGDGESYTYFCRICSERLAEFIEEDRAAELLGRFGDLEKGLRAVVWVTALTAAPAVRFPTPTDPKQFASVVTEAVYPLVMAAEEEASRKTRGRGRRPVTSDAGAARNEDDEEEPIDPKLRLYAILFVYAYVLNLIQSSETARTKGGEVGLVGVRPGSKISVYADHILTHVATTYKGLLSQIEDISAEFITARFKEAFRLVRGDAGDLRLKPVDAEEELANQTVMIDPIYHYAASLARSHGDLPPGRAGSPAEARKEFELVMGDALPSIVKKSREYAKLPALAPLYAKKLVIEVPADTTLEFLNKDPRVNLYSGLYQPKWSAADAASVKQFYALAGVAPGVRATGLNTWIGGREPDRRGHRGPPPAAKPVARTEAKEKLGLARWDPATGSAQAEIERGYALESYRLFATFTTAVSSRTALERFLADLKAARAAEAGHQLARAFAALKCLYSFGFVKSRQFEQVDVAVTELYDENGERHAWTVLVFRAPDGALIEVDAKGATRAIEKGTIVDAALVNVKCAICGVLRTGTGALDVAKTARAVRITAALISFFGFYEARCPKGGLHAFAAGSSTGGGARCGKCGMPESLSADPAKRTLRNPEARAYYDQFEGVFAAERREIAAPVAAPTARPPRWPKARRPRRSRRSSPGGPPPGSSTTARSSRPPTSWRSRRRSSRRSATTSTATSPPSRRAGTRRRRRTPPTTRASSPPTRSCGCSSPTIASCGTRTA